MFSLTGNACVRAGTHARTHVAYQANGINIVSSSLHPPRLPDYVCVYVRINDGKL